MTTDNPNSFEKFELPEEVLKAVQDSGYTEPTPIQEQAIPPLLEGRDIIGQAQTGTGKTAAFALPILSRMDAELKAPQVLVLAPTRELAIQVSKSFETYGKYMKKVKVVPIYGGQSYDIQIRQLKKGTQIIVGTPGRVMDHIEKGTLKLDNLQTLVLDEADEMLRMGFIEDVEWILEHTPEEHQVVLFSATMPQAIQRIAQKYLSDPISFANKVKNRTAETIKQVYCFSTGREKRKTLVRLLEAEAGEGTLIFARTRAATVELSEFLEKEGFSVTYINGDLAQKQREYTVKRFKSKQIDILVATDVAARGLDLEHISLVINFDLPDDTETYVHRVGRTGRAGREGKAIILVTSRDKRMLRDIERATRQTIREMDLPNAEEVNVLRIERFKQDILQTIETEDLTIFDELIGQLTEEQEESAERIAAALAYMYQGEKPFLIEEWDNPPPRRRESRERTSREPARERSPREKSERTSRESRSVAPRESMGLSRDNDGSGVPRRKSRSEAPKGRAPEKGMDRFRIDVGHNDQVKPANIVGAIANEAGIDSTHIGQILIYSEYSTVDLPEGMPRSVLRMLKKVWVAGKQLNLSKSSSLDKLAAKKAVGTKKKSKSKGKVKDSKKVKKKKKLALKAE